MKSLLLISLVAGLLTGGPVLADKPEWAGKNKGGSHAEKSRKDDSRDDLRNGAYFNDHQRTAARQYYDERYHASGRCPPGLAKKNNGCQPPGQAKKWQKGQPLPRNVVFHDLPRDMVERLGPPPSGHRYVRIATDLLLIATGTGMVIDAIDDLVGR